MSDTQIGDRTLGMNHQAVAVLEYLAHREPDFAECCDNGDYKFFSQTYAWYNGKERGFSLTVAPSVVSKKFRIFVVVEGRNHDGIVVYEWEQTSLPMNGPMLADFTDEAYKHGRTFSYGAVGACVEHIYNRMAAWWGEMELGQEPSEAQGE